MKTLSDHSVRKAAEWLEAQQGLRLAIVFGSAASGQLRADSDLDVAVLGDCALDAERKRALIEGLAEASGRAIDVVDLSVVGQPLLGRILAEGRRCFGADEDYAALVVRNIFDRADFLPYQERILDERRQAWIGHCGRD